MRNLRLEDTGWLVCYDSIKRGIKRTLTYEYRCDERLKTENEESTRLSETGFFYYYYSSIKRELQTRPIYECRCDERLKTKGEESTRLDTLRSSLCE